MTNEIDYETVLDILFNTWSDIQYALPTMYRYIIDNNCRSVLELGVRWGTSTITLLLAVKQTNGHLTSIDINECIGAQDKINTLTLSQYWTFINKDDLKVTWDKPIDMLFIDTSHTYEQTLAELEKYSPYVTGAIFLHDTVEESCRRAIEEFILRCPLWRYEELGGQYGLGKLTKVKDEEQVVVMEMLSSEGEVMVAI